MHKIAELDQTGAVLTDLTPRERRTLNRVADQVGVEWRADGSVRVYSKGNVGSVALSPATSIEITPKLPVGCLYSVVSLAFRTLPVPASVEETLASSAEPLTDMLALLFVGEVERLVRYGMRQGYIVVEDALPYVRGRLRPDHSVAWTRPGLIPCEFADFLTDTPENRVLRLALELLHGRKLLRGLPPRIAQLLPSFYGVSYVRAGAALLSACRLTRLNEHYRPALELARLVIEQTGAEAGSGELAAPAFFLCMEDVFEKAIANYLEDALPKEVHAQRTRSHIPVDVRERRLNYIPDIVIGDPSRLVLDTKWARPEMPSQRDGKSWRSHDFYQAAFYALSLHCPAVLVYPSDERDIDVTFRIQDVQVSILSVDLRMPGLAGLEKLRAVVAGELKAA